jgi:2-keto-4-pentenoate hydratase/2-oxohepta-3-ene-1,7-dioic acid hydratase in catechol pathway
LKLVTFQTTNGPRAGVLSGESVFDTGELLGSGPLRDIGALLDSAPDALERLKQAIASTTGTSAKAIPLATTRLCAPILRPPTVRDFFAYEGHSSMGGQWKLHEAWYRLPVFYFSNPLCVYGPGEDIPFPSTTTKFDFELELAAVIGREGRNVVAKDAWNHIAGFTIMNDWSSRDLQRDEMQAGIGTSKGKDAATSLGPCVVTLDELAPHLRDDRLHLKATLTVNGVEWVAGDTGSVHHDWPAMIERASRDSRIVPGDVIGAGTITGGSIAEAMRLGKPARYLKPGDVVEISMESLGTLKNTLTAPLLSAEGYRYLPPIKKPADAK